MPKPRLKHIVVILPGITGSVLQKDGKDIWAFSGHAIRDAIFQHNDYLHSLQLPPDDPADVLDLGDGVTATTLIRTASLVPGFIKLFDGYNGLSEMIRARFEVVGAGLASNQPSNLYEFPYDWRRDNRVAARGLMRLVEERLAQWRKYTYDKHAKVILLAHSMGGLVARYYLEVLEGWRNSLALVTFGTPFRGSLNAINFLANGYKKAVIDLSSCLRSFTSVYQLLPTYPAVRSRHEYLSVADCTALPGIEQSRAQAAAEFHAEIERKVTEHRRDANYLTAGYKILPFVGTRQPTLQSATFKGSTVQSDFSLPPAVHELLGGGDGTVPRYSAVPFELSDEFRETYASVRRDFESCRKSIEQAGREAKLKGQNPVRFLSAPEAKFGQFCPIEAQPGRNVSFGANRKPDKQLQGKTGGAGRNRTDA
jgi:pimeloyl-ACP methyl ester carboxylesterase